MWEALLTGGAGLLLKGGEALVTYLKDRNEAKKKREAELVDFQKLGASIQNLEKKFDDLQQSLVDNFKKKPTT